MTSPVINATLAQTVSAKLALDFTTASLDARVTLTRALNTATRVNSSGVIETVNADVARFDYDPITLACKGLLIEEARTNSTTYSQDFGSWSVLNAAVDTNEVVSPDGTQNADQIADDATTGAHIVFANSVAYTSGLAYTISVFAKAGTATVIQLTLGSGTVIGSGRANFNLANGVLGTVSGGTATITNFGSGWYRCTFSFTAAGSASTTLQVNLTNNSTTAARNVSYSGSAQYAYVWGAQREEGNFPTSYIPNLTTGTTTRNADVVTMTGDNFSDWYNISKGTFRVDASNVATGIRPIISADDNTANNSLTITTDGTTPKFVVTEDGSEQANVSAGAVAANVPMFAYVSYDADYFGLARPTARSVDTSGTVPTADRLRIGANQAGSYLNGHIQSIQFWP